MHHTTHLRKLFFHSKISYTGGEKENEIKSDIFNRVDYNTGHIRMSNRRRGDADLSHFGGGIFHKGDSETH